MKNRPTITFIVPACFLSAYGKELLPQDEFLWNFIFCNFSEIWISDLNRKINHTVHINACIGLKSHAKFGLCKCDWICCLQIMYLTVTVFYKVQPEAKEIFEHRPRWIINFEDGNVRHINCKSPCLRYIWDYQLYACC